MAGEEDNVVFNPDTAGRMLDVTLFVESDPRYSKKPPRKYPIGGSGGGPIFGHATSAIVASTDPYTDGTAFTWIPHVTLNDAVTPHTEQDGEDELAGVNRKPFGWNEDSLVEMQLRNGEWQLVVAYEACRP